MVTSRPYQPADLQRLIQFLIEMRAHNPAQRWHPGDLVWRMFYSHHFDPAANVRLWEDEHGALAGFVWRYPPEGADLNPRDPDLLPEMIDWAQSTTSAEKLYVATLASDTRENALLAAQGFQRTEAYGYRLRRRIDALIPRGRLPWGFTLRTVAGEDEAAERAALHRTVFESEAVTDDGYRNVMRAPLYERELDLIAIAPDGRMAAFCLCWLDTVNRVGLFEPVGTHPDFRRMGLARSLMLEGLRQMRERGMKTIVISCATDNIAGLALYLSLEFKVESREQVIRR